MTDEGWRHWLHQREEPEEKYIYAQTETVANNHCGQDYYSVVDCMVAEGHPSLKEKKVWKITCLILPTTFTAEDKTNHFKWDSFNLIKTVSLTF